MSRSRKDGPRGRNRRTKEYTSKRPQKSSSRVGGWPVSGRYTKTKTHRVERRQADRLIFRGDEECLTNRSAF